MIDWIGLGDRIPGFLSGDIAGYFTRQPAAGNKRSLDKLGMTGIVIPTGAEGSLVLYDSVLGDD